MTNKVYKILSAVTIFVSTVFSIFSEVIPAFETKIIVTVAGILLIAICFIYDTILSYINKQYQLFKIRRKRFKIAISLDIEDNGSIVEYCNIQVKKFGLGNKIIFQSKETTKRTDEKFRKMVEKENFDLVIWTQKLPQNGKVPLFFTYKNTTDNLIAKIVHFFINDIQMQDKAFRIQKETIVVDIRSEKNNITYTSLYIVAVCATFFRGIDEGLIIFEKLLEELVNKKSFLEKEVRSKLKDLYTIKGVELCRKSKYLESEFLLDKAYEINQSDQNILSALTIVKYQLNKFDLAENFAIRLIREHPDCEVAQLNIAFFKVRNRKYTNALKHYKRFVKAKPGIETCNQAISFLYDISDREPDELGYIFALGFVKKIAYGPNDKFGESTYVEDFMSFVNHTVDRLEYNEMCDYAKKIIQNNKKL